jgi:7-cyano-7-deazaguanine synthase in queuosine biosynthesis
MSQASLPFVSAEYSYELTDAGLIRGGPVALPSEASWQASKEYYINDEKIADSFGRTLSPLLSDWLDVALATYLADRLSPRVGLNPTRKFRNWRRVINLKIPVRRPNVWNRPVISNALVDLLGFFTDDLWQIRFVRRRGAIRLAESNQYLFSHKPRKPIRVALLSGGLDSFSGAAIEMAQFPRKSFVFVSALSNPRQRTKQREQIRALSREFTSKDVRHVAIPFGLRWHGNHSRGAAEEQSQRGRGFLFLTLGCVTAFATGVSELSVYENGIGAINLPYDASQLSAANSRTVHPVALLRMSEFVRCLSGRKFVIINRFLSTTKGGMCSDPAVQQVSAYLPLTFSCDAFPLQVKDKPQCGSCTSCLLRRVSLHAAGLTEFDPGRGYRVDLLGGNHSERQLRYLRVMEWQYQKIKRLLNSPSPWVSLTTEFPELRSISAELSQRGHNTESKIEQDILKLYSKYVAEWDHFPARALLVRKRAA